MKAQQRLTNAEPLFGEVADGQAGPGKGPLRGANGCCIVRPPGSCGSCGSRGWRVAVRRMTLALALVIAACGGGADGSSATTESTVADESSATTESTVADAGESGQASFAEAHMAGSVDTSAEEPDPSTYADTFAADEPGIFVVYLLDADAEVDITWNREGEELLRNTQQTPGGRWAEYHINPAPGGFLPGQWEVVLEIVGGDDREVLTFTVSE